MRPERNAAPVARGDEEEVRVIFRPTAAFEDATRRPCRTAALITILKRDGVLQADCRVAVVEIRKSHMPVRLLSKVRDELLNPMPGTYLTIDETQAILATTGKPGPWDKQRRTASTLLVRLTETSTGFDIREIAEDVYRLTHLNWSAPEIEISLPVTIRWNDDSLRYSLMKPTDELDSQEADEFAVPAGSTT